MTKNLRNLSVLGLIATLFTGCATLSKQDCQVADWQAIGQRDGTNGRAMDYLQQHAKACGKINITPDKTQWEQGRQQGLKLYCTPSNAFNLGKNGNQLNLVCPAESLGVLQRANSQGLTIYHLNSAVNSNIQERDKLIDELEKMRNGSNLHFKTEKEARAYMVSLPDKIRELNNRIRYQHQQLKSFSP